MKGNLKGLFRVPYHWLHSLILRVRWTVFGKEPKNLFDVPIIINNFNRVTYLKRLIESLEVRGYRNIYIIDNASTYPPLLEYYDKCPYTVFRLKKNVGYLALWDTEIYKEFYENYFVYTDSDLVIHDDCPADFMSFFYEVMRRHKNVQKVGFGLKIDDLPDNYDKKDDVIKWESTFWTKLVEKCVYLAPVDTTFAIYRPFVKWGANFYVEQYRTAYPYLMHHLPWYANSASQTDEDCFYSKNVKTSTHWTGASSGS